MNTVNVASHFTELQEKQMSTIRPGNIGVQVEDTLFAFCTGSKGSWSFNGLLSKWICLVALSTIDDTALIRHYDSYSQKWCGWPVYLQFYVYIYWGLNPIITEITRWIETTQREWKSRCYQTSAHGNHEKWYEVLLVLVYQVYNNVKLNYWPTSIVEQSIPYLRKSTLAETSLL